MTAKTPFGAFFLEKSLEKAVRIPGPGMNELWLKLERATRYREKYEHSQKPLKKCSQTSKSLKKSEKNFKKGVDKRGGAVVY